MASVPMAIGRTKTALVYGSGMDQSAVISVLNARVAGPSDHPTLHFAGPGTFADQVCGHLEDDLLALVNRILALLGQAPQSFELSIANVGGASACNTGIQVTGYSADLPAFLAMLSAALALPLPQDVLATGHIASPEGDITFVEAIPVKLAAAVADRDIRTFVYPGVDHDRSLTTLSPAARQAAAESLISASHHIRTVAVDDIGDAFKLVFDDTAILLAAMRSGFYSQPAPPQIGSGPIAVVVQRLHQCGEPQFRASLEHALLRGDNHVVEELLDARIGLARKTGSYPSGLGHQLMGLVRAIPPATRNSSLRFPLLPLETCIPLSRQAGEADYSDYTCLLDAVRGLLPVSSPPPAGQPAPIEPSTNGVLDRMIEQIDQQALTELIRRPIDEARAGYCLTSSTVTSAAELIETVAAYQIHLMNRCRPGSRDYSPEAAKADALDLLERAFVREGGWKAAVDEAVHGRRGGIRRVLDAVTEQFRQDEERKHVNRVFKESLDPFDYAGKAALIDALRSRLAPHLPPDVLSAPAAHFADNFEPIVAAYVESLDRVTHLFRRL